MRLLLHNFLDCNIKTVKNGYPLKIEAEKVKEIEVDYDPDFLRHMFNRIDYKALREAAETLGAWRCLRGLHAWYLLLKDVSACESLDVVTRLSVCFSVCVAGVVFCCRCWAKQVGLNHCYQAEQMQ